MAIKLNFDSEHIVEHPTLVLAHKNGEKIGTIPYSPDDLVCKKNLNSGYDMTVKVYRDKFLEEYDGKYVVVPSNKLVSKDLAIYYELVNGSYVLTSDTTLDTTKTYYKQDDIWHSIVDFKLLYCPEWNVWFEIFVDLEEGSEIVKSLECKSLGEAELSQIMIFGIEINTEDAIKRDDYVRVSLYEKDDEEASLLDILMKDKASHYHIGHIDLSLINETRKNLKTFTFDNKSLYDCLLEICEELNALLVIDSSTITDDVSRVGEISRTINMYDLETYCSNCYHRGNHSDFETSEGLKCPNCGNEGYTKVTNPNETDFDNGDYYIYNNSTYSKATGSFSDSTTYYIRTPIVEGYGEDTTIFVSVDNLTDTINYSTDNDSVKNCFRLKTGDDYLDAVVKNCNPNGSEYLWFFNEETMADMSDNLIEAIEIYDALYNYYQKDHIYNLNINGLITNYNLLVTKYNNICSEFKEVENPKESDFYNYYVENGGVYSKATDNYDSGTTYYTGKVNFLKENAIGFPALMQSNYDAIDFNYLLEHSLMPSINTENMTVTGAISNLSGLTGTLAIYKLSSSTSQATVENAVTNAAKILTMGYFKIDVHTISYSTSDGSGSWNGYLTVSHYYDSDDDPPQDTGSISITLSADDATYCTQLMNRKLVSKDEKTYDMVDLFNKSSEVSGVKSSSSDFALELKKYGLVSLTAILESGIACRDILIEQGVSDSSNFDSNNDLYTSLYIPICNKIELTESEIQTREDEIACIGSVMSLIEELSVETKDNLDFRVNLEDYNASIDKYNHIYNTFEQVTSSSSGDFYNYYVSDGQTPVTYTRIIGYQADTFTYTNSNTFILTKPNASSISSVYINGTETSNYTLSGNSISITDTLVENDIIKITYQCEYSSSTTYYVGKYNFLPENEDCWTEFCSYRREDEYSNSNYVSDGLNSAEAFARALEFIQKAQKDIYKSATLQHSITATLDNLLMMEEFAPIVDYFEVGNWIRVSVNDRIYRLRLLDYEINFGEVSTISVTFSDVTQTASGLSDIESVLNAAHNMSSSYSTVSRQANKGNKSNVLLNSWFDDGLSVTNIRLKSDSVDQTQSWDDNGMLFRRYIPDTEEYDKEQIKIINSTIAMTDDNWKTVKTAVGKFTYRDMLNGGAFTEGFGINGELLVGRVILGNELGIYDEYNTMSFNEDGLTVTGNNNEVKFTPSSDNSVMTITKISNNSTIFGLDTNGNLEVQGKITATELCTGSRRNANTGVEGAFIDRYGNFYAGANNQTQIKANGQFIFGSGSNTLEYNGSTLTLTGKLECINGHIGGFGIYNGYLGTSYAKIYSSSTSAGNRYGKIELINYIEGNDFPDYHMEITPYGIGIHDDFLDEQILQIYRGLYQCIGNNESSYKALFQAFSEDNGRIIHKGNFGVSNTDLGIYSETCSKWVIKCDNNGNVFCTDNSDIRLKTNIEPTPNEEMYHILKETEIINYTYKNDKSNMVHNGISAQNLRDVLINNNIGYRSYLVIESRENMSGQYYDLLTNEEDVTYSIDYRKFTPLLWKGWQYHDDIIEDFRNEIESLKAEIKELKGE